MGGSPRVPMPLPVPILLSFFVASETLWNLRPLPSLLGKLLIHIINKCSTRKGQLQRHMECALVSIAAVTNSVLKQHTCIISQFCR